MFPPNDSHILCDIEQQPPVSTEFMVNLLLPLRQEQKLPLVRHCCQPGDPTGPIRQLPI